MQQSIGTVHRRLVRASWPLIKMFFLAGGVFSTIGTGSGAEKFESRADGGNHGFW